MQPNPYSDETTNMEPTDALPEMDALQPRQAPHHVSATPQPGGSAVDSEAVAESGEIRQDEGQAIFFTIAKLNDFLQWIAIVLEVLLAIRIVFHLIGADPTNTFANFLYGLTGFILAPFNNIVPTRGVDVPHVFEWSTLIAMIIYWLAFWALRRFLHIIISNPKEPVE